MSMTARGTSRRYRSRRHALAGLHAAVEGAVKWVPTDDLPERMLAETDTRPVVVATVNVPTDQRTTFAALTDPAVYSRWLGAPVSIRGGRFAATMEWGTEVRGTYELVCPPELIVMKWDFEDGNVPIPGGELVGYLRVTPGPAGGAHVEVHQLVDLPRQAEFMEVAWGLVLGRLKAGVAAASDPAAALAPRTRRDKRRRTA